MAIAGKMAGTVLKGVGLASPVFEYKRRRREGQGTIEAFTKSAAEEAAWAVAPGVMAAATFSPMAVDIAHATGQVGGAARSSMYKANFGGQYFDTQNAYTMRQRGVQAIQKSGMNTRSVLGSEARRYG